MTDDELQMILDCQDRESRLTDWERGFIDRLASLRDNVALSDKQRTALDKTWERVAAPGEEFHRSRKRA